MACFNVANAGSKQAIIFDVEKSSTLQKTVEVIQSGTDSEGWVLNLRILVIPLSTRTSFEFAAT